MKAKKVACVVAGTVMSVAMAVSLTACSGDGKDLGKAKLNLADYAIDYNEEFPAGMSVVNNAVTQIKKLNIKGTVTNTVGQLYVVADTSNGGTTYGIYNVETEKFIAEGIKNNMPSLNIQSKIYDQNYRNQYNFGYFTYSLTEESGLETVYNTYCYTVDGTLLMKTSNFNSITAQEVYLTGESKACIVLVVTGSDSEGKQVTNYFKTEVEDGFSGKTLKLGSALSATDIAAYSPEYEAGNTLDTLTLPVYEEDEDGNTVEGEMAEYSYSNLGYTYTFYKNGEKTGSVEIKNLEEYAFVDNYMYYTCHESVDMMAQTGFNYVSGYSSKYNYTLHRYDILKDKDQTLNYNVVIDEFTPLYNYELKKYDALIISGWEKIDGIAYANTSPFAYVVNKDLKIAYDLKEFYGSSFQGVAKLSDNRYMVVTGSGSSPNMYITDENLSVISKTAGMPIPGYGRVVYTVNGNVGFTDLDGKIICAPKYNNLLGFYGGISYAVETLQNGKTREVLIDTDGKVMQDLSDLKTQSDESTVTVECGSGFYSVITTTTGNGLSHYAYYDFSGKQLVIFDNAYVTPDYTDDSIILEVELSDGSYEYYKVV